MVPSYTDVRLLDLSGINISPEDFDSLPASSFHRLEFSGEVLARLQGVWRPRAIVRWMGVEQVSRTEVLLISLSNGEKTRLRLGCSSLFLAKAQQGLVGVYTAGEGLAREARKATLHKRYLEAYLYEMLDLVVLEKIRHQISSFVEKEAAVKNWGIGPFLSPGSVHGWELYEQDKLCSLVPLDSIDVTILESGTLRPSATVSCLIGIGPEYEAAVAGSTCEVCTRRHNCEMQKS